MNALRLIVLVIVLGSLVACQPIQPAPGGFDPADFSTDHRSNQPYIMFDGTPYEHLMVPVADLTTAMGVAPSEEAALAQFAHPEALATTAWLADHLADANLRIVDVRWDGQADYGAAHIPGAVYADLFLDLMTPDAPIPSVAPPAEQFSATMQRLGINNDTTVVVYDTLGGAMGGARLWWLLNYYGHDNVKLLNGGWTQWTLEGRPTEAGASAPAAGDFTAGAPRDGWRATAEDVQNAMADAGLALIDALPVDLYTGDEAHSAPIRDGHIPTAANLPAPDNLDPTTLALLPKAALAQRWATLGLDDAQRPIAYCEAGVFSALDFFVLYQLGYEQMRLYEASLMEWGTDPLYPMAAGSGIAGGPVRAR